VRRAGTFEPADDAVVDMMPNPPHMYSHHQYAGPESAWMHQNASHPHHAQQAAAAASAAQQQHYNRLASVHNTGGALAAAHNQDSGLENVSEDNRRTMSYIADLLNENTREAALLELSKKREQVPELALILWHSFGTSPSNNTTPLLPFSPPPSVGEVVAGQGED